MRLGLAMLGAMATWGVLTASAQAPRLTQRPAALSEARLGGVVVEEGSGTPLRRARVILQSSDGIGAPVATETGDRGEFLLRDVKAGTYSLTAVRDGYLTTTVFRRGALRMPQQFRLLGDEKAEDLTFRMRRAAALYGRVRYEDGDPAVNVRVALYREIHLRGRRGFTVIAGASTNDRGEYRIFGLPEGAYYMAAVIEGDRSGPGIADQPRLDNAGREIAVPSYTTTFYPGVTELFAALPVRVSTGDDLGGVDLYLKPVERRNLRGRITSGATGVVTREAAVVMERIDSRNMGGIPVPVALDYDNEGFFTMKDVAPGRYQIWATMVEEDVPLSTRQDVLVTNADIEGMEILLRPGRAWDVQIGLENAGAAPRDLEGVQVRLEPRSERGRVVQEQRERGRRTVQLATDEVYDVFVERVPEGTYFARLLVNGADVRASGLTAAMASDVPVRVVLDGRGGKVEGRITDASGNVLSGAEVKLVPDGVLAELQDYREVYADEFGVFRFAGVAPGRYTVVGWLDDAACEIWEQEGARECAALGAQVEVAAGALASVALQMKSRGR